jgi:hypothetical protein
MRRSVLEPVVLNDDERETLGTVGPALKERAGICARLSDHSRMRQGSPQHRGRSATRRRSRRGRRVASWLPCRTARGLGNEPRPVTRRSIGDDAVRE